MYECEKCTESSFSLNNVLSTVSKLALIAGVGYFVFNYRKDIKEVVDNAVKKGKTQLSGRKRKN